MQIKCTTSGDEGKLNEVLEKPDKQFHVTLAEKRVSRKVLL